MAKDYEPPVTPPRPARRTLNFENLAELTPEEANAFGLTAYQALQAEAGQAEDNSFAEERFGVQNSHDAQAATARRIPAHAPRTGVIRPTMGRRR